MLNIVAICCLMVFISFSMFFYILVPRGRKVVHARVSNEAQIGVVLNPGQRNVRRSGHVGYVQPERDVRQGRALHFMQRARVAYPHREVRPSRIRSPRVLPNGEFRGQRSAKP